MSCKTEKTGLNKIYMARYHQCIALSLVFILAFQPVAAGFAGCMQTDKFDHAGHGTQTMVGDHAMHQHAMNDADVKEQQGGCLADCDCAGMCLHACHALSLPGYMNIIVLNVHVDGYSLTHGFSSPGYTVHLLRPPAISA